MDLVMKRGRGRPSKAEVAAREERMASYTAPARTDEEIMEDLTERFRVLRVLTQGAMAQNIRSFIVSGAPGVGKTYSIEKELEASGEEFTVVKGAVSAVNLYKLGYEYRHPGNVIVLDDADNIFADEEGLNLLKTLCDSSLTRRVSWLKQSHLLREEGIPQQYEFQGSFVFVTNLDFQRLADEGKNKFTPHFAALMSRSLYLDLKLHDRNTLALWVKHVAIEHRIFQMEKVKEPLVSDILEFITDHKDSLRELSIRTLMKVIGLAKTHTGDWHRMATMTLCRN